MVEILYHKRPKKSDEMKAKSRWKSKKGEIFSIQKQTGWDGRKVISKNGEKWIF